MWISAIGFVNVQSISVGYHATRTPPTITTLRPTITPLHRSIAPPYRRIDPLHRCIVTMHPCIAPLHRSIVTMHRSMDALHRCNVTMFGGSARPDRVNEPGPILDGASESEIQPIAHRNCW